MTDKYTANACECFNQAIDSQNQSVKRAFKDLQQTSTEFCSATSEIQKDTMRIERVIDYAPALIHDINTQFEMATKLNKKDIAFLFGAAAIQTIRWAILPSLDLDFKKTPISERLTSAQGGQIEKKEIQKYLSKSGFTKSEITKLMSTQHIQNYTWEKLLIAPVPYDAMHGSARIEISNIKNAGVELYGKNHHVATWGHDPIWGWIIGPLNISSRMITFRDFQTFHVAQIGDTFQQQITYRASMGKMIKKSVNCWSEDSKKLFASVAKQGMHLQSDKYTKGGLPIPLLRGETAQKLLMNGWNSAEAERIFLKALKNLGVIGIQFVLSLLVDYLVRALHLLCYDESVDGSYSTYAVKTNKIVCYSNLLSEIGNGIFVVTTGQLNKLDVGGYINLAKNLLSNANFKAKVKAEFLEKELERQLYGEEYYFAEVKDYGV